MFRLLVLDARSVHPEQVMEYISEFTLLDNLYHLDCAYEFAWERGEGYDAIIIIDTEQTNVSPHVQGHEIHPHLVG